MNQETQGIIIVLVILAVFFLIWYYYLRPTDGKRREKIAELIWQSSGGFDDKAKEAQELLGEIENMNAGDNFLAGNILEQNVLQGRLANGANSPQTIADTFNYYINAMDGVAANDIRGDFMIDHVQNVLNNGVVDLAANDFGEETRGVFMDGLNLLGGGWSRAKSKNIEQRINDAAARANTKEEFARTFLADSKTHTSNPQNVHDTAVSDGIKNIYLRLREEEIDADRDDTLAEIAAAIDKYPAKIAEPAKYVLDIARAGNSIMSIDDTEDHVLKLVWDRSKLAKNAKNAELIRAAIIEGMAACVTSISPINTVCIVGRVSNYIGALATLDADKWTYDIHTEEEYKNEIFGRAQKMFDGELAAAERSDAAEMQELAAAYKSGKDLPLDARAEFLATIKNRLDAIIGDYDDKLRPHQLETIKKECMIAFEL